ncbi:GNAT family N-acetyltransferase [Legionella rowbothamii]|uniref:GNAT family N-acetyltransferase n=1 Tax=Legionella rowbothamii TaxID=96229 RepID=UPI001F5EE2FC|nr:GNAT family N-acetyltransferase [Legionella rowbothamii]MDP3269638.1 GNAT family N-acetyltransferase [Legionella sp.]
MTIKEIQFQHKIIKATPDDYPIIQRMWPFYVYDMGRYCGLNKGWECPVNPEFTPDDLTSYFINPREAFLIKVKDELAGFILLNKVGTQTNIDWNMGEFFILAKYQGKGIGQGVVHELWKTHLGIWEISVIPENKPALEFWRKAISTFTASNYTEEIKAIKKDSHQLERYILSFDTDSHSSINNTDDDSSLKISFVDSLSDELDKRMTDGFITYETSHGIDVNYKRFSVILSKENNIVCGVINAFTAFAEIYVDDIWVDSAYRGRGYGKKLLQTLEDHFKGQGFNNINLVTSAFQAPDFYKKCGFTAEFTRVNKINPQLSKTFFVKFFEEGIQTQGLLKYSE